MTFLKNAYIVLGAVLGIATVYLAPCFLAKSSSSKKSKNNEGTQTESNKKEEDTGDRERTLEVSESLLVQNQSNEEAITDKTEKAIIDEIAIIYDRTNVTENAVVDGITLYHDQSNQTENAVVDGIALIHHQSNQTENAVVDGIAFIQDKTKEQLNIEETKKKSDYPIQPQSNEEPVNGRNASEALSSLIQNENNVLNDQDKEKTVKKTFVKKNGEEKFGVVLQYVQAGADEQLRKTDWDVKFQSMEDSSSKYTDANSHFVTLPNEILPPEKLNTTAYESFEDSTKHIPLKPPRIRHVNRRESFERSKLTNKTISIISSKKPSAQSTLLETNNKRIEIKESDDIEVLAEETNIHHSTFESENLHIEAKSHKALGHKIWRRYVYIIGNFLSAKKRTGDRSKLLDAQYTTEEYGNNIDITDLIDDQENFKKYRKLK